MLSRLRLNRVVHLFAGFWRHLQVARPQRVLRWRRLSDEDEPNRTEPARDVDTKPRSELCVHRRISTVLFSLICAFILLVSVKRTGSEERWRIGKKKEEKTMDKYPAPWLLFLLMFSF